MTTTSIIIPTCGRTFDLGRCLQKLVPQLPADGSCELILSDDGDLMHTKAALAAKLPAVNWTPGLQCGPGRQPKPLRKDGAR